MIQRKAARPLLLSLLFPLLLAPAAWAETIRAGMHAEDVTPVIGVPLAGFGGGDRRQIPWDVTGKYPYATFLKPSTGKLDAIRSKALVIERGAERIFFVSVDIVGSDPILRNDVIAKTRDIGVTSANLFISATHTHSGPGTVFKNPIWELLATDRFQRKIYEAFAEGVAASIRKAVAGLEESEILASSFEAKGLQKNRRIKDGPVDRSANLLWVRSTRGAWLGAMANLPLHGTSLGMKNHSFSSDVLGSIERGLEDRLRGQNRITQPEAGSSSEPVVLFVNGAEGDVTPSLSMQESAEAFANQALASLAGARLIDASWQVREQLVTLPRARLNTRGCVEQKTLKKILGVLRPSLARWMPQDTRIWSIRLGDMWMMTWPGEPTTALGLQLKKLASEAGYGQTWVMGLTNDHKAYFTSHQEYDAGGYEACSTLHGYEAGERLLEAHAAMLAP